MNKGVRAKSHKSFNVVLQSVVSKVSLGNNLNFKINEF